MKLGALSFIIIFILVNSVVDTSYSQETEEITVTNLEQLISQIEKINSNLTQSSETNQHLVILSLSIAIIALVAAFISTYFLKKDMDTRYRPWVSRSKGEESISIQDHYIRIELKNTGSVPAQDIRVRVYTRFSKDPSVELATKPFNNEFGKFSLAPNGTVPMYIGLSKEEEEAAKSDEQFFYGILLNYVYTGNRRGSYRLEGYWIQGEHRVVKTEMD